MQRNLCYCSALQGTLPQTGLRYHKYRLGLCRGREHGIFWSISAVFIATFCFCPLPFPENLIQGREATDSQARDRLASTRLQQNDEVNVILEVHQVLWPLNNAVHPSHTRLLSLLLFSYLAVRCMTVPPVDYSELIKFRWCECSNMGSLHLTGECPSPQPGMHYE